MKEKPILFRPELVRAILDGRKTVTRRPVKPQPDVDQRRHRWAMSYNDGVLSWGRAPWHVSDPYNFYVEQRAKCPYYADRLWVRETWGIIDNGPDDYPYIIWKADRAVDWCDGDRRAGDIHYVSSDTELKRWRPSIHMPRWASRLTLEVTDIRAERLQEITEEDAKAEGVEPFSDHDNDCWSACNNPGREHLAAFEYKWNEIYGWNPNSWASNPWVWRVAFRVVEPVEAEIRGLVG